MVRFFRKLLLVPISLSIVACAGNFYDSFANKTTDDAVYVDAVKAIDNSDYSTAITKLLSLSSAYQNLPYVIETLAAAYAGRCGQVMLNMVTGLTNSSNAPMLTFMNLFQVMSSSNLHPLDCYSAQTTQERLGTYAQRTTDQNYFLFFLGVSKIGTMLRTLADPTGTGSMTGTFNSCTSVASGSTVATTIADDDLKHVISGLGLIFENINAISASINGAAPVAGIKAFAATCAAQTGLASCAITDPNSAQITAPVLLYFRELLRTTDIGITGGSGPCTASQIGTMTCCP